MVIEGQVCGGMEDNGWTVPCEGTRERAVCAFLVLVYGSGGSDSP